jgi:hypothetical protein
LLFVLPDNVEEENEFIPKSNCLSNINIGSFGFLVVGVKEGLIQRFIRFSVIIGQDLKVELWDFDLGSHLAIESRRIDAIAK